jgi:hypothetical protein
MVSFSIKGKESDHLQQAIQQSKSNETNYVVSPVWYNYAFFYYYEDGKYFKELFDFTHQEPNNVKFDYNPATFDYTGISNARYLNVIVSNDASQVGFPTLNTKLENLGYRLSNSVTVNKACKSYLFEKR